MERQQVEELLYQALETEIGGVQIYATALRCARNGELKKEWQKYHKETQNHEQIMRRVCKSFGLDLERQTPGRRVVRHKGEALVQAMEMALQAGPIEAAQLVAAECVVEAETKDHMNWELIGKAAKNLTGDEKKVLKDAHKEVEEQEDEHLYHTMGWARELWLESLGIPAVIPPPEEEKDVKTAIGAARAKHARGKMIAGKKGGKKSGGSKKSAGKKAAKKASAKKSPSKKSSKKSAAKKSAKKSSKKKSR